MKRQLMLLMLAACGVPSIPNATPEGPPAAHLAAARDRTCLISPQGALRCWGADATMAPGLDQGVTAVAAAAGRTLVLKDGTVIDEAGGRPLGDRSDIAAIAISEDTTCGLSTAGDVICPDGAKLLQPLPGPATAVAAGDGYACALLLDRTVRCWGASPFGTGNPPPFPQTLTVPLPQPAKTLRADATHACATLDDDSVWCIGTWIGLKDSGCAIEREQPVAVPPLTATAAWASSVSHTCRLDAQGTVACWGYNAFGEVGVPPATEFERVDTPTPVKLDARAVEIAVGDWHSCALLENGTLSCWGADDKGQLDSPR
jgi:hypothetical protein